MNVSGDDNDIGGVDGLWCQNIPGSLRTLGFDLYLVSHFCRPFFQGFGCHDGMGDSCRTGGDRNNFTHGDLLIIELVIIETCPIKYSG